MKNVFLITVLIVFCFHGMVAQREVRQRTPLIGKSPGVTVDMDKNSIVQGKSGVQIFVNGRPTRLTGNDLSSYLESLRSENIESMEIITNPSSKYEAEGTVGLINIVLKKNSSLGFNGNATGSYSKGISDKKSVGTSLFIVVKK